jgi:hypothetical protein
MGNEIETINDQLVAVQGDSIIILRPKNKMTKEEALRHAAWLVVLAEDEFNQFRLVLEAVKNT